MIILRNRQLIKNDFLEEVDTFQTIISEKQNEFEMNLHLSFQKKESYINWESIVRIMIIMG